jgi:hypothetical protein
MPYYSRNEGLMDIARQVIGCHSTQETRVYNMFDEVVSTMMDNARHVKGCRMTQ